MISPLEGGIQNISKRNEKNSSTSAIIQEDKITTRRSICLDGIIGYWLLIAI